MRSLVRPLNSLLVAVGWKQQSLSNVAQKGMYVCYGPARRREMSELGGKPEVNSRGAVDPERTVEGNVDQIKRPPTPPNEGVSYRLLEKVSGSAFFRGKR